MAVTVLETSVEEDEGLLEEFSLTPALVVEIDYETDFGVIITQIGLVMVGKYEYSDDILKENEFHGARLMQDGTEKMLTTQIVRVVNVMVLDEQGDVSRVETTDGELLRLGVDSHNEAEVYRFMEYLSNELLGAADKVWTLTKAILNMPQLESEFLVS